MNIEFSERLNSLPPYLFAEIDKARRRAIEEGRDIIDLGVGDPDSPTPDFIVEAMKKAIVDGVNHHYALDLGMPRMRQAIAGWYERRFRVKLDPDKEVLPLIGSKEGIAHLPLALINPKDKVLVPEPCYPPYRSGVIFAGGKVETVPLLAKNRFLPDLSKLKEGRLIFVNYPNNPTAAVADANFYKSLVDLSNEKGMMIASDLAYSEIYFDDQKPSSLLEVEHSRDAAIEFHSLSKTFNMTGWRIGWACGNSQIIGALSKLKTNIDSGIFQAVQVAGITALEADDSHPEEMRRLYQERRDYLINGLRSIGWKIDAPTASFYVWAKLPKGYDSSLGLAKLFLEKADIIVTPGIGFGKSGEGYVRFALTVSRDRINEAVDRLKKIL
ncbi:MAG: LL-diaminopimelate aminotransferase [Candidatus Omnitrophota bacterium]